MQLLLKLSRSRENGSLVPALDSAWLVLNRVIRATSSFPNLTMLATSTFSRIFKHFLSLKIAV